MPEGVVYAIVSKTKGASAAFIKELMRRSAQFVLQAGGGGTLTLKAVDAAIEEMVIVGGSLNMRLLGASDAIADTPNQVSVGSIVSSHIRWRCV